MSQWLLSLASVLGDPSLEVRCLAQSLVAPSPQQHSPSRHSLRAQRIVHWNAVGNGFIIESVKDFEAYVLPKH